MMITSFFSSYAIHTDALKPVYIPYKIFSDISLILPPLDLTAISSPLPWRLQNTGQWHENIPFEMPLLLHYSFVQKISIQLPLA